MNDLPTILVLGAGDVGSAVAHRLFAAGYPVVIHDAPAPATSRRGMAFADAIFDGRAGLSGVTAVRVDDPAALTSILRERAVVPVVVFPLAAALAALGPNVLIDARMRKRAVPDSLRGLAPLTVGLGPGFVAGTTVDVAVETSWDAPGAVVDYGATLPLAGEPRPLDGHARDRYVYAPVDGVLRTDHRIGDVVTAGATVAEIDGTPLAAPLDGRLRGLTRDGVAVVSGTKVIEVDPRRERAVVTGIGERPAKIADGVLVAVRQWSGARSTR